MPSCMMRGVASRIHRAEAVLVVDGAGRGEVEVGHRRVGQTREIQRAVDAAELRVVERIESVQRGAAAR